MAQGFQPVLHWHCHSCPRIASRAGYSSSWFVSLPQKPGPRASGGIALMLILGWSALTTSGRLHGAIPRPWAQVANEHALAPPEWIAHEAIRVRLRGGPALVRGCLKRRKGVGNGPVTTSTGGRKLHGVRGTAGCLGRRLAAGLCVALPPPRPQAPPGH